VRRRNFLMVIGTGVLSPIGMHGGSTEGAAAQNPRYTIQNDTNQTIFAKLVGHTSDWISYKDDDALMSPGAQYHDNLFPGERMLVIWDRAGKLVDCAKVVIDNNPGHISIQMKRSSIEVIAPTH